ncbi:MAG: hypothetical protein LBC27_04190 [Spirochaetaceae bacterium]|jgi:hypothetical protein|nr:hypothetical protein [Spirochaetaceae bacterium]
MVLPLFSIAAQETEQETEQEAPVSEAELDGEAREEVNGEDGQAQVSPLKRWFAGTTFSFGGSVLIFQEDYGLEAAPIPVLPVPSFAFTFPPFGNDFIGGAFETTLDMYFTHYKYSYVLDRPVPAEIENRSAFVFGPIFALQMQVFLKINIFRIRLNVGIAGDFRITLLAEDLNEADLEDAQKQTEDIAAFFSKDGRWLFPVAGLGLDIRLTPRWRAGFDFRVWAPIDFSGADEQFLGWRFGLGFRVFGANNSF